MFKQTTTIIVGAGASCELGLPSGDDLKSQILTLLSPAKDNAYGFSDPLMQELMRARVGSDMWKMQDKLAPVRIAADRIRRGLPLALSIDNFLHAHQGDVEVEHLGKTAIAIAILRAESRSLLIKRTPAILRSMGQSDTADPSLDNEELLRTWHMLFAQLLLSQIHRENINRAFRDIRFVIFNYDRCLEQFLWMALQAYFDISQNNAAHILSGVSFIHPYGSLGPLPWEDKVDAVEFGGKGGADYANLGSRIRTFTESVESEVGQCVKEAVAEAETILVLGFGYLDQNLHVVIAGLGQRAQESALAPRRQAVEAGPVGHRAILCFACLLLAFVLGDPGGASFGEHRVPARGEIGVGRAALIGIGGPPPDLRTGALGVAVKAQRHEERGAGVGGPVRAGAGFGHGWLPGHEGSGVFMTWQGL